METRWLLLLLLVTGLAAYFFGSVSRGKGHLPESEISVVRKGRQSNVDAAVVENCFQDVLLDVMPHIVSMMVPERRFATLWLAKTVLLSGIDGDFLEAGVANGGGSY